MKTGLFGGTFDPIHIGHLTIAEDIRVKLQLDRVIFIPARQPWLKVDREISEGHYRLQMVKLAIASNRYFEISDVEMIRPGPSYTVDTVEEMRRTLGPEDDMYFIAGSDAVMDMPLWKQPERVVSLCRIAAAKRPRAPEVDTNALKSVIPEVSSCINVIDVSQVDISSTAIRERIREGQPISDMVPDEVERYIRENGLYL